MWSPARFLPLLLPYWAGLNIATANCLTDQQANQIAQNYAGLFSQYSASYANSVLTNDFEDQSDSVNWLTSNGTNCPKPLGAVTYNSRQAFEMAAATQPSYAFRILNVYHDCDDVIVRWQFDPQAGMPQEVRGIAILNVVENKHSIGGQPYLIRRIFSEFNVGAFLVNEGWYTPTPPPGCAKRDDLMDAGDTFGLL